MTSLSYPIKAAYEAYRSFPSPHAFRHDSRCEALCHMQQNGDKPDTDDADDPGGGGADGEACDEDVITDVMGAHYT